MSPSSSSAITRRRLLGMSGASAAALALAACGGGDSGGASSTGALTWYMWSGSNAEADAWKYVGDLVTKADATTKLTFQTSTFNDFWTKLTSQAASGNSADIVGMQAQRAPQFQQLLVPLDDSLEAMGVNPADFDSSIYDGMKVNGKLVALPYDFGPSVIFYNRTAFQAAGLPEPAIGWTQDDFLTAAKALTKGAFYGFNPASAIDAVLPFVLSQHGVAAVNDAGELDIDNDAWKQTLQWYADLITKEKVAPPVPAANTAAANTNQFLSGNAAMTIDGPWSLINARSTAKFEVGIAPMPAGASGSRTVTAGSGFGVSTACKDPERAKKAIAVLTGVEAEEYLGTQGRAFPSRTAQQSAWYEGNKLDAAKEVMDFSIENSIPFRTTATWTQVNDTFNRYAVSAYNGDSTVADLVSRVQAQSGAK
ncbi:extracellular solute-binding protein [Kineococcus sp. R8]|uniref:ABC transporter substrate-binding protein n=1 Tax=Kineococcus siccus TaxID=2696567 RepID=UPI001412329C|nr:sugar ABC transporter substrate-binding protein [Kineococcus siccus]NAZ82622.1 extracellular solute-binding protein [Kineococcus siccus]